MYCRYCGSENPDKSKFCRICGGEIGSTSLTQKLKFDKIFKSKHLFWKVPLGIIIFCILAGALLYAFSSSFREGFNSGYESSVITTQDQTSSGNATDYTQSVIDIECDNQEGGSGTIISQSGYVLTNNHVIKGASSCLITLPDTTTGQPKAIYTAKPVVIPNLSQQYDLAFLNITGAYTDDKGKTWGKYPTKFPDFNFSNSCKNYTPKLGDNIKIYGYPVTSGGYNLTVTDGIISSFDDNNDILTSAKIDSGNSGGLAVNSNGCYVGVPSAVVSGNYQNLGVLYLQVL